MSVLLQLGDYRNKESEALLRELFVLASRGRIRGFSFAIELVGGGEKIGFTGSHRDPSEALKMATKLKQRLTAAKELREAQTKESDDEDAAGNRVRRLGWVRNN